MKRKKNNGIKYAENPKFFHHRDDGYALYEISNEYDECFAYSVTVPPSTFVCISWLWFSHHFSFTIDGKQSKLCLPLQHLAEWFSRFNFSFIISATISNRNIYQIRVIQLTLLNLMTSTELLSHHKTLSLLLFNKYFWLYY